MSAMAAANRLLNRTLLCFSVVFAWPTLRPTATLPNGFSAILLAAVGVRVTRTAGQLSIVDPERGRTPNGWANG